MVSYADRPGATWPDERIPSTRRSTPTSGVVVDPTQHRAEQRRQLFLLPGSQMLRQLDLLGVEPREQLLDLAPSRLGERDADEPAVLRGLRTPDEAPSLERGHDPRRGRPADPNRGGQVTG